MICFQLLSLSEFFQYSKRIRQRPNSCDLLSTFIFVRVLSIKTVQWIQAARCDLLSTFIFVRVLSICWENAFPQCQLWFAFNFYLCQSSFNYFFSFYWIKAVVICFQLLSLSEFFQLNASTPLISSSCDLLSTFIFVRALSMAVNEIPDKAALWFAFNFYLCQSSFNLGKTFRS